ncbi:MAG: hypothetical protein ACI9MF_000719, partial [Gammaproteobacteria bacterium]
QKPAGMTGFYFYSFSNGCERLFTGYVFIAPLTVHPCTTSPPEACGNDGVLFLFILQRMGEVVHWICILSCVNGASVHHFSAGSLRE